jgi:hypothetical protein
MHNMAGQQGYVQQNIYNILDEGDNNDTVDTVTTNVADAEAAWDMDALLLQPTWPILVGGRDTNSLNLEASPGQRFLVSCLPHSRDIKMV